MNIKVRCPYIEILIYEDVRMQNDIDIGHIYLREMDANLDS